MEVKVKQDELKEKLTEINQKIAEISEKSEIVHENNKDTENMETFLTEYRQKLEQLEFLISNLTISEPPKSFDSDSDDKQTTATNQNQSTWRTLIDMRLKRAKDIISKLTSMTMSSNKPTTTVTKYLPTSNNLTF